MRKQLYQIEFSYGDKDEEKESIYERFYSENDELECLIGFDNDISDEVTQKIQNLFAFLDMGTFDPQDYEEYWIEIKRMDEKPTKTLTTVENSDILFIKRDNNEKHVDDAEIRHWNNYYMVY